jgi:hypothetical protein
MTGSRTWARTVLSVATRVVIQPIARIRARKAEIHAVAFAT